MFLEIYLNRSAGSLTADRQKKVNTTSLSVVVGIVFLQSPGGNDEWTEIA